MTPFLPTAQIIADSLNVATGDRLTTFVLTYPRFIHAELLTHRLFSRNSSSSRAIPTAKALKRVRESNVLPLHWGKNQKGMQAWEELDEDKIAKCKLLIEESRERTCQMVEQLLELGLHKQVANRYLEPYDLITVLVTSTEYNNFFNQRFHSAAQPEMQALAYKMLSTYTNDEVDVNKLILNEETKNKLKDLKSWNSPQELSPGEWHLPFILEEEKQEIELNKLIKISTGRSARVSYLNHFGIRNTEDDLRLHNDLISDEPKHLSPLEHPCMAAEKKEKYANLTGFKSYRWISEN